MKLTKRILAGGLMLGVLGAFSSQAAAATITIASFADPTVGAAGTPPPYLFMYDPSPAAGFAGAILNGGYSSTVPAGNPDLTLNVLGTVYTAAGFTFPTLTATNNVTLQGLQMNPAGGLGTITFFNSANAPVLFIDFNMAFLSATAASASDLTASVVNIRLPAGPDLITDPETFAFSFSNITGSIENAEATDTIIQATAAFTSSATIVPEPGTLALLGLGLAGLGFGTSRRKKVAA